LILPNKFKKIIIRMMMVTMNPWNMSIWRFMRIPRNIMRSLIWLGLPHITMRNWVLLDLQLRVYERSGEEE